MAKYTTLRLRVEDKRKLERIALMLGARSLSEAFRLVLELAETAIEQQSKGEIDVILRSLRRARDIGPTDAEKIDEMLYGGEHY